MIPRLLSSIYRKSRTVEKTNNGEITVDVTMSYYEIYNDKVYDLFESPDKRSATGLPIREAEGGKTTIVGLTEVPCGNLKDFEVLYDQANANRSTGATKLNAHSSRSHAILCVKLTITTPTETRVSTASAIDLAGSEDNRRTGNGKERMVESASINKSLFVLAQCVEAISKKQQRVPYRESKMTRILSLGQNNGFTIMILNLAPVKSYHLDTLSSLNFANRTKKIEVREVENEPIFQGPPRQVSGISTSMGLSMQRQPLRPLLNAGNANLMLQKDKSQAEKPLKAFSVYADKAAPPFYPPRSSPKRNAESSFISSSRPNKIARCTPRSIRWPETTVMSKATIESMVETKVAQILANRNLNTEAPHPVAEVSVEVQRRLDSIEQRLAGQDGARAEGLSYLFMAKQHPARAENFSALKMYELAQPYFPGNQRLEAKIEKLKLKLKLKSKQLMDEGVVSAETSFRAVSAKDRVLPRGHEPDDESYHDGTADDSADASCASNRDDSTTRAKRQSRKSRKPPQSSSSDPPVDPDGPLSPRTHRLLSIINTRDVTRIKALHGVGVKRAEGIVESLRELRDEQEVTWGLLSGMKGIGKKTLESMRAGVVV